VSHRHIPALIFGLSIVFSFALIPLVFPSPLFHLAVGDLIPLLILVAATVLCFRNSADSHGHLRLFWSLMTGGFIMWTFNQAGWAWYELILRKPLPDPFPGDVVLFLHVVPIMGAVAIRPNEADQREGTLMSGLNVLILLVWWVIVYAYFVFPQEFVFTDIPVYTLRWDLLYLVENLVLIGISASAYFSATGAWRRFYANIFIASVLYTFASEALNAAIARGVYRTGGIYDVPFLMAILSFLWLAWNGRRSLKEMEEMSSIPRTSRQFAPLMAQLALLSLPAMGYYALFLSHDPPHLSRIRFAVAITGVAILAFFIFLKQYLLDHRLLHLLNRSRSSFDNLKRLQSRVIQQAKLASLGELVALAASELEYPLSAILESSERLAASSSLTREQLGNAQKIGQQARRTRELVNDLLSFAQQTPGEKIPLELKPLLQRAIQMEGFKLENRNIVLTVENMDAVPRVLGNSNQLLQAFVQIVENAVDALQEVGGGRLQISSWREADEVVVQFADSGPGLHNPERVFDPFYTTKPVGKGTGLGLSATYGVILDHKGQITCFNRPEGGAAFEIRLPAIKPAGAVTELAPA
jgi:signal transduction histidine kinase